MRHYLRHFRPALISIALVGALLATAGCTMSAEKKLVGVWRTRLTGYNTGGGRNHRVRPDRRVH